MCPELPRLLLQLPRGAEGAERWNGLWGLFGLVGIKYNTASRRVFQKCSCLSVACFKLTRSLQSSGWHKSYTSNVFQQDQVENWESRNLGPIQLLYWSLRSAVQPSLEPELQGGQRMLGIVPLTPPPSKSYHHHVGIFPIQNSRWKDVLRVHWNKSFK